jgi:hypothetical protein
MVRAASTDIEPPGVGSLAIDLTHIVSQGAVYDGEPLIEVVLRWAGGEMKATLRPPPDDTETESADSLGIKIMTALRASPVALTRKQLAKAMGRKSIGGRFSPVVSALVETSQILERERLLTDDASKFPDDL